MKKRISLIIFTLVLAAALIVPAQAFAASAAPGRVFAASTAPYYIEVNCTTNIVAVYKKDAAGSYTVPVKTFICSSGVGTPTGTFRTTDKYVWRPLFDNVYGQYATRITGHILFHSVPYLTPKKNDLEYAEYNKLGQAASAGCIRLCVRDTKWIYDNCPRGTTVKIYRGDKTYPLAPEPVGKTDVNDTVKRGWDPTDPDVSNPWLKVTPNDFIVEAAGNTGVIKACNVKGSNYLRGKDMLQLFSLLDGPLYAAGGQAAGQGQALDGFGQAAGQSSETSGGQGSSQGLVTYGGQGTGQSPASGGQNGGQSQTSGGVTPNGNPLTAEAFTKLLVQNNAASYNRIGETIYKLQDGARLRSIAVEWNNGIITLTSPNTGNKIFVTVK